jgi:hypothetical protein
VSEESILEPFTWHHRKHSVEKEGAAAVPFTSSNVYSRRDPLRFQGRLAEEAGNGRRHSGTLSSGTLSEGTGGKTVDGDWHRL